MLFAVVQRLYCFEDILTSLHVYANQISSYCDDLLEFYQCYAKYRCVYRRSRAAPGKQLDWGARATITCSFYYHASGIFALIASVRVCRRYRTILRRAHWEIGRSGGVDG